MADKLRPRTDCATFHHEKQLSAASCRSFSKPSASTRRCSMARTYAVIEAVGPFTVERGAACDRTRWRHAGKQIQAAASHAMQKGTGEHISRSNGLADSGYCGLTTALAAADRSRRIDQTMMRLRSASGAQSWEEIFADDVGREFVPNDFDMRKPDESTERLLSRAVRDMTAIAQEIMLDPTLAVDAPWNDLRPRAGCTRTRTQSVSAEVRTPDVGLV